MERHIIFDALMHGIKEAFEHIKLFFGIVLTIILGAILPLVLLSGVFMLSNPVGTVIQPVGVQSMMFVSESPVYELEHEPFANDEEAAVFIEDVARGQQPRQGTAVLREGFNCAGGMCGNVMQTPCVPASDYMSRAFAYVIHNYKQPGFWMQALILLLVVFLLMMILGFGSARVALDIKDRDRSELSRMFVAFSSRFLSYFGAVVIYFVLAALGFAFFFIPGVIVVIRLCFFPYFMLDQGCGVIESLKCSWHMTKPIGWQLFGLFIFGMMVKMIAYPIGLTLFPIIHLAKAYIYRASAKENHHHSA